MICCVLLSFLVGIPQRLWRRMTRRGGIRDLGSAQRGPRLSPDTTVLVAPSSEGSARPGWRLRPVLLRSVGAGVAVYLVGIQILLVVGAADTHADAWLWAVRSVLFIALGAACVRLGGEVPTPSPSAREVLACGLAAGGLTWFELGAIDMHLFAMFNVADGAPLWDAVFHGAGVVFAVAGWALVRRDGIRRAGTRRRTTMRARRPHWSVTSMRGGSVRSGVAD